MVKGDDQPTGLAKKPRSRNSSHHHGADDDEEAAILGGPRGMVNALDSQAAEEGLERTYDVIER